MRDNIIRLRLVIRRHALPEVRVVFSIQTENDPTIANLLEQVNDIVPLESNDWGLEDYAVELRDIDGSGFECMHFQNVATVLKNDEQVVIRPLVTEDRKKRRLSGRHQISSDGKHLIDGIAFGRPRLKTPRDRPSIDIPPLKRRRLTYDAGDSEPEQDSDEDEPQLLLTEHGEQSFNDVPFDDVEDEDEEDEFVDGQGDDVDEELDDVDPEEIEDELRGLREDIAAVGDVDLSDIQRELGDQQQSNAGSEHSGPEHPRHSESLSATLSIGEAEKPGTSDGLDLLTLDKITALRAAFPTAPADICEKTLLACNKEEKKAYNKLRRAHPTQLSLHGMLSHLERLQAAVPDEADDISGDENGDESEADSVNSLVKHYDEHGFPAGSIFDGTASRQMAESLRMSGQEVKIPVHTRFDDSDDEEVAKPADGEESESDSDEDMESEDDNANGDISSEDGNDSSGSSDESDFKGVDDFEGLDDFDGINDDSESGKGSDNDGDSDSDSDSGPEEASSRQEGEPQGGVKLSESQSNSRKRRRESDSEDESESDKEASSDSDSDEESDSDDSDSNFGGISSESGSDSDSDSDSSDSDSGNSDGSGDNGNGPAATRDSGSDSSNSDSSSDSSSDSEPEARPSSKHGVGNVAGARVVEMPTPQPQVTKLANQPAAHQSPMPAVPQATVPPGQGKTTTQRRNARRRAQKKAKRDAAAALVSNVDQTLETSIAAKKAALLKSLGLQDDVPDRTLDQTNDPSSAVIPDSNPLSGAETSESKETEASMPVPQSAPEPQPTPQPQFDERISADQEHISEAEKVDDEEDPEAWREKVNYYGVECCQEGVELSEPPFPFEQRWDPQQRRSKRKQHAQSEPEQYSEESRSSTKRRRQADYSVEGDSYFEGDSYMSAQNDTQNADITLNYDEDPSEFPAFNTTEQEQHHDADDLVSLPDDLSTFPPLEPNELVSGMAVAWKQLLLSKVTNWQPQIRELAGVVVDVDGDWVRIRLAKKFRDQEEGEKTYDELGNRVYDKFEQPGVDDEDADAHLGYRELDIADMTELRVLKKPAEVDVPASAAADVDDSQPAPEQCEPEQGGSGPARDESTTLDSATLDQETSQVIPKSADKMDVDYQDVGSQGVEESQDSCGSVIPETYHDATEEPQPAQELTSQEPPSQDIMPEETASQEIVSQEQSHEQSQEPPQELPISEDRRKEISQLISEAGFRKEIDPSITEEMPDLGSPSHQLELEDMAQEVVSTPIPSPQTSRKTDAQANKVSQGTSQEPSNFSSFNESQPILLEPFNGFSDEVEGASEARVGYPDLNMLHPDVGYPKLDALHSDNGSVRSGRQPDPDYSMDLGHSDPVAQQDPDQDTEAYSDSEPEQEPEQKVEEPKEPEPKPELQTQPESEPKLEAAPAAPSEPELKPEPRVPKSPEAPAVAVKQVPSSVGSLLTKRNYESSSRSGSESSSMSSFPSLNEIIHTASTARSKGTPAREAVMEAMKARKSSVAPNLEYEEAMRKLDADDQDSDDEVKTEHRPVTIKTEPKHGRLPSLAETLAKPIEKPVLKKSQAKIVKAEPGVRVAPPPRPRISSRVHPQQSQSSQFSVPEGTQVISLLSSSPEPEVVEDYADDSIDETYTGDSPMSKGSSSWTNKKTRRGASLPASSIPRDSPVHRPVSASQGRHSMGGVSYPSLRGGKKKTTIARVR